MSGFLLSPDLSLRRHLRLWIGVLQLAIDDVKGYGGVSKKERPFTVVADVVPQS